MGDTSGTPRTPGVAETLLVGYKKDWFSDPVHIGRSHHVALRTENREAVTRLLQKRNIPYHLRVIPGYGDVRQLFFYDPDGNGIEVGEFAVLQPAFCEAAMIEDEGASSVNSKFGLSTAN
ncbi:hypothetical protein SeMB42_g01513 [Synchytrium endobioticum]|uniref:VOC domain-containing protein n=1 Tax=Synchytrium endobioticum TaxID=286115 RepID=A0A507DLA5_9FUNG|nr:hypothetical protein SeMB42_g01513 [Synchytrium endobioticum]